MQKLAILVLALSFGGGALAKEAQKKERSRIIQGEGKIIKGTDSTVVDFEEVSISGERRDPMGSMINQKNADKDYNFVRIRKDWQGEISQSTQNFH